MHQGRDITGAAARAVVRLLIGAFMAGSAALAVACGTPATITGVATAEPAGAGRPEADTTPIADEKPDLGEISRHPADLPDSPDYALYRDGRYEQRQPRSGPMVHEVHLTIQEGTAEIVPGTRMEFWTFDGKVPGPMLRARVGDTLDVYVHNPEDSSMPHNVDFHAATGPDGGAMALDAAPGAVSRLRLKLLRPGIYVYHCAFPDAPTHISMGMYGLIVVEPEEGLPPVDHEYYLMQSEFYTEAGGELGYPALTDQGFLAPSGEYANLEQPTFVVFNGRPEAVIGPRAIGVHAGEAVRTGERIRIFAGNIGPNLVSSFHVIGAIFDRVYVEGSFALVNRDVQTTLIPAGGAAGVELEFAVPGDYRFVDHAIFRIHKGALGEIHVQGEPNPDVFQPIEHSSEVRRGHAAH